MNATDVTTHVQEAIVLEKARAITEFETRIASLTKQ
jgi:hypothetical protein